MTTPRRVSPFEAIRHTTAEGDEYWSARELAPVLDYSRWQRFWPVIEKAMTACVNSGQSLDDHFTRVGNMVQLGSGAERAIDDWLLSRYACYLIVQNGDPEKPVIAAGQTYFAVRTRQAELSEDMAGLPEAERRLPIRDRASEDNKLLAATAFDAGVVTPQDFGVFQDHGYRGMYAGETASDIAARKGLRKSQKILDHMGSAELALNWVRITQTEEKIRREGISDKTGANLAHHTIGAAVRQFVLDQGGTPPEQLPTPVESIQQLRRKRRKELAAMEAALQIGAQQGTLFPLAEDDNE
jgi:DNA-damage-inducible protein D